MWKEWGRLGLRTPTFPEGASKAERVRRLHLLGWRDPDIARELSAAPAYVWDVLHGAGSERRVSRTRAQMARELHGTSIPVITHLTLSSLCPHCGEEHDIKLKIQVEEGM